MRGQTLSVLAVTNMYPTKSDPTYGSFVASQMESIERAGMRVAVDFIDGRRGLWQYAIAIARVRKLAASGRFGVVHAHYGLSGFSSTFQTRPLVVSFCGDDLLGTPGEDGRPTLWSRAAVFLSQIAARRADAIICKSEGLKRRLPQALDLRRVHVIPNGVDTTRFAPGDRLAARSRLGLNPNERLVLFPNTPHERRKRIDLAERAVQTLCSNGVSVRLLVVSGVPPRLMPDYYRAADCLLLTSDWEGSPNVVKEALCCDLPVVSVDVGDVYRWLELTSGGRLVSRSPDEIARGLHDVLMSATRLDGSRARTELGLARIAARVIGVYEEAIERAALRDGNVT